MHKKASNGAKSKGKGSGKGVEQKFSVPAAYGSVIHVGKPQINGSNSITVRHTEYLDDIVSLASWSVNPAIQVYALNPGLVTSFPWLGNLAAGYEQYRFKKLAFRYRSRTGTGTSGTVYFSTQLDSADPDFASKEEMYAYSGTQSTAPWIDMTHNCLLARGDYLKKYFIRTGELDSDEDSQLYDSGKFTFVPLQSVAGVLFGELLVDYEVELFNPKMNVADVGAGAQLTTAATGTSGSPFAGGLTRLLWGAADFVGLSSNAITFAQSGLYQISVRFQSSAANMAPTDATVVSDTGDVGINTVDFHGSSSSQWDWRAWVLVGTAAGASLVFAFTAGTLIAASIKISSAPVALAALLGGFSVSLPEVKASMERRYKRRKVKFELQERKQLERKERAVETPAGDEQPALARAPPVYPELREDQIQGSRLLLLSRGQSPVARR